MCNFVCFFVHWLISWTFSWGLSFKLVVLVWWCITINYCCYSVFSFPFCLKLHLIVSSMVAWALICLMKSLLTIIYHQFLSLNEHSASNIFWPVSASNLVPIIYISFIILLYSSWKMQQCYWFAVTWYPGWIILIWWSSWCSLFRRSGVSIPLGSHCPSTILL